MQQISDIKSKLIDFISEISVERFSDEWKFVQLAIGMLCAPKSFKKDMYVLFESGNYSSESGAGDKEEASIKICPDKISLRYYHRVYSIYCEDMNYTESYRYVYPNDKYKESDFDNVLSCFSGLFDSNGHLDNSDYDGHYIVSSNFKIKINKRFLPQSITGSIP